MNAASIIPGRHYLANIACLDANKAVEVLVITCMPEGALVRDQWRGRGTLPDLVPFSAFTKEVP
jgi:hypothetical protein